MSATAEHQEEIKSIDVFRRQLKPMESQFQRALPKQIDVEKFVRVVETAVNANQALLDANRMSLFSSAMKAAQDGLLPDGREAAFVTFNTKSGQPHVQYMPMITGILKKIRNSGELESISSSVVYENDFFENWIDEDGEHFKHKPNFFTERGAPKLAYAFAKTKDGGKYFEAMNYDQIERVRACSRSGKAGPWVTWWDEMARKTVMRRLAKRLPMSSDLDSFIRSDDDLNDFSQPSIKDVSPIKQDAPERPTRLQQIVNVEAEIVDTNQQEDII